MMRPIMVSVLTAALFFPTGFTLAADPAPVEEKAPAQEQKIYGSQLMTQQERVEYRAKMRFAKTVEEQEQIRNEHHEVMRERAKARGVALPDEPPVRGGVWAPVVVRVLAGDAVVNLEGTGRLLSVVLCCLSGLTLPAI
ncbi:MAG: hypothetical protein Q7U64_10525 [Desulfocapsaceae bacterium]|nr:hypothetical protein [Desulfocapsaceae bacterium]